jgi:hypothetical protein
MAFAIIGATESPTQITKTGTAYANTSDKTITFLVDSSADLANLPACLPGSIACTQEYFTDPAGAGAFMAVVDVNGAWAYKA